jgi:fructose-specific component phosphotransferase system IIB-like protein
MARSKLCTSILLGWFVLFGLDSSTSGQSAPKPSRDEATKAIRAAAYNMMKAFLTVDVATFKRHSAKRTLDLVGLVFEAARQDPRYQPELEKAHITNADLFLGFFLQGASTQYLQSMPVSPEAAARHVANDSTVTFITDADARINAGNNEVARARLVGKVWKIDLTDALKKPVLKEVNDPAIRAKIKAL